MASAGIPVSKEPQGLSRSDGKRPDGFSLIPWHWQAGKPQTWDVTVVCPLADSYVAAEARETDSVITVLAVLQKRIIVTVRPLLWAAILSHYGSWSADFVARIS